MTRFGILLSFQAPAKFGRTPQQIFAECLEQAVAAERLGFESVWVTEHHFENDSYLASPIVACAAIAAKTERVRIGQAVLLLPLFNPVRLAEDIATIDLISGGRIELGIGMGYRDAEFFGLGINRARRRSLFEENLEILRRAWTEDEFDYEGTNWQLRGVKVRPQPIQKPHPTIWFGGKSDPALLRAAKHNAPFLLPMLSTISATGEHADKYRSMLDEAGYSGQAARLALLREVWVADSPEAAWNQIRASFEYVYRETYSPKHVVYHDGNRRIESENDPFLMSDGFRNDRMIFGDPAFVSAEVGRYVERTGLEEMICRFQLPGMPHSEVLKSMERFATEVAPLFA